MPTIRASISADDVRRKYYESAGYSMWITEMQLDPLQLIVVDDSTGKFYRVPIILKGDELTFSDAVEVAVTYVDTKAKAAVSAMVWASRADSLRVIAKAIPSHTTEISDGSWGSEVVESRIPNDATSATLRKMYAWVDPEGDADTKAAYKFPHHAVAEDGTVGAANMDACSGKIGELNGAHGNMPDIPDADRQGVYNHLAKHIRDGGKEPPEMMTMAAVAAARIHKASVANTGNGSKKGAAMALDAVKLREALGLAAEATDEEVTAALSVAGLSGAAPSATSPPAEPGATVVPAAAAAAGAVVVDAQQFAALRRQASEGAEAFRRLRENECDAALDKAIKAGKIPPASRDQYKTLWAHDPDGTSKLLDTLTPNVIPMQASGYPGVGAESEVDIVYAAMYPDESKQGGR